YAFIFYQFRWIYCDSRLGFNNRAVWFCMFDIVFYDLDRLFVCAINFLDDGYIGCSETYFACILLQLMTRTMWIKHCNCKVWFIKGIIIIATIPYDYITTVWVIFCFPQYCFIIYTCINDIATFDMRFIFFHFFNCTLMLC